MGWVFISLRGDTDVTHKGHDGSCCPSDCMADCRTMNPTLRRSILCACVLFTLPMAHHLSAQTTQEDMEKMKQQMLASGAAHELAAKQFTKLPKGVLYLRFENFSTRKSAHQSETPLGVSLEWAGRVWLLT